MQKSIGNFLNLAIFLFLFFPLHGEYKTNVQSISRREGLSNGAVNTIVKDAEGYIWFGTWNGLNRYDGSSIRTYMPGTNPSSIHNHVIREIYPASDGSLWMLTNKGITLYDNYSDKFTSFFTSESDKINYEKDICLSQSDTFGTFVSIFGSGIFKYNPSSGIFDKLIFDSSSVDYATDIIWIHQYNAHIYCIDSNGKLLKISGKSIKEVLQLPKIDAITASVSFDVGHHHYILIAQRSASALMIDLKTNVLEEIRIPDEIITSFAISQDKNTVWTGTENGEVYSFNPEDKHFRLQYSLSDLLMDNPINTRILSIYETAPDILWIGTDGNGVYTIKLTDFPNKSITSSQLAYPIVRSILVTRKGDILVGTKGGGIDIFNANGLHLDEITVKNGLTNNSVLSFYEAEDGSIWIGTDGQGVDILAPDYKTIRNYPLDFKAGNDINFASVYRIFEDSDKRIYLGTSGYGVIRLDFDNTGSRIPTGYEQLILDKSIIAPAQQKQIVYAMTEEKPGIIWIGTRGLGVFRYNTITKRVMEQYSSSTHPGLIKNDDILSLFSDINHQIWVGSSNGLFILNPLTSDTLSQNAFKVNSDLSNISIHGIQLDKLGNLWVTTNIGLSLVDPERKNVRSFNSKDGLVNFEYSDGASFYDSGSGKLYVGGTMGIDIIQTDELFFNSYFPPIVFNQLFIRNQPVQISEEGILKGRINLQKTIRLKYDQEPFSFAISPLSFWGQERYRISYRLVNYDDLWINNPNDQFISFSNLSSGTYFLQVRISDESGNWSNQIRELEITIDPPYWLTSYAIAGYIILFGLIQLIIITTYRKRESRKKEYVLQEYKKRKEEELQSYKLEFFTNVAHEFRTPLTLITSHIHALLEDAKETAENPRLLKIFNNSIKLQKLVLEIMQFRKLEKGKEPLNIQLLNPVKLVSEVISDLETIAQKGNVHCELIAENKDLTFKTDADKFQRIASNLISNALKYNKQGGFVRVFIGLEHSALKLVIEDNGMGIKPEFSDKIFEPFGISSARKKGGFPGYRSTGLGLAVTRGLVELLKGEISFESRLEEGTKFSCLFPDILQINPDELPSEAYKDSEEYGYIDETGANDLFIDSMQPSGKPLILVVDDEPEILMLLRDFLQADYDIIFAENGVEAYNKVLSEMPDLIVSDVMMPEMDGIELCSKLRANFDTSHLPVIFLAAKGEIEDRIAGLKAGADSYIPKPFHPEHLKVRIEKLLHLRASIMSRFARKENNSSLVSEIEDPFFGKLLSFIDENLDDVNLSSEKICDKLAISKSSLYNKTKSVLGITPHSLIYQRRLSKAAILLKSTPMTVSEIIDHTGFASRTYFYDLFNREYDCSPSEYRNQKQLK